MWKLHILLKFHDFFYLYSIESGAQKRVAIFITCWMNVNCVQPQCTLYITPHCSILTIQIMTGILKALWHSVTEWSVPLIIWCIPSMYKWVAYWIFFMKTSKTSIEVCWQFTCRPDTPLTNFKTNFSHGKLKSKKNQEIFISFFWAIDNAFWIP